MTGILLSLGHVRSVWVDAHGTSTIIIRRNELHLTFQSKLLIFAVLQVSFKSSETLKYKLNSFFTSTVIIDRTQFSASGVSETG
jgi:hypothetical protein